MIVAITTTAAIDDRGGRIMINTIIINIIIISIIRIRIRGSGG